MSDPASAEPRFPKRRLVTLTLFSLALVAALATAHFRIARAETVRRAGDAHARAAELDDCVGSRDAIELSLPDDHPAAECAAAARRLVQAASELEGSRYQRARERVSELVRRARALEKIEWNTASRRWLEPPLADVFAESRAVSALGRSIAEAEGAPPLAPASAPSRPIVPEPQILIDTELSGAITSAQIETSSAGALVIVTIEAVTESGRRAFVARSTDRGEHFRTLPLPVAGSLRPHLTPEKNGGLAIAVFDEKSVTLGRSDSAHAKWQPITAEAIALPADLRPVSTGTSLLALEAHGLVLALAGPDGRGQLLYPPYDGKSRRELPEGRLIAATASAPPRVLLARSSKTGFVELAQIAIPGPGDDWPAPQTSLVSYVSSIVPVAGPDRACGLSGEQFFTWLGRSPNNDVLIASGPREIYPFRFQTREASRISPTCGGCPPGAFETSAQGLRVFPAVRRQLAPTAVTTALAFEPSSASSAVAACSEEQVVVAYVAGERVLAQGTHGGTWRFDRARVIAEPSQHGSPRELAAVGLPDRTLAVWRRAHPRSKRLRVEAASILPR